MSILGAAHMASEIALRAVDPTLLIVSRVDSGETLLVDFLVYICCQLLWWLTKYEESAWQSRAVCLLPNLTY